MEAFGRIGAGAGVTGAGFGAVAADAAAEGITTPATLESGAQAGAPSYQARSEAAKVPSASLRFTSSMEKGPSCWPFLPTNICMLILLKETRPKIKPLRVNTCLFADASRPCAMKNPLLAMAFALFLVAAARGEDVEWTPEANMDHQLFPSMIIATATVRPVEPADKEAETPDPYLLGERFGLLGVSVNVLERRAGRGGEGLLHRAESELQIREAAADDAAGPFEHYFRGRSGWRIRRGKA